MNITVFGAGYVGLSFAVMLSQFHNVRIIDIDKNKVDMINARISPIKDIYIEDYFANKILNLSATTNEIEDLNHSDYIIIAVPTNYDEQCNSFNTQIVENVLDIIKEYAPDSIAIIKSTVPIGFSKRIQLDKRIDHLIISPEFLRESNALYDCLNPSRIIIGIDSETNNDTLVAKSYAELISSCIIKPTPQIMFVSTEEAEAIKLFSNSYLAMRIGFFNELDTFAENNGLDSQKIIHGVCLDSRIGDYYNNPSFGFGGYCLPKDTKQLISNYKDCPPKIISAIIDSNQTRIKYIADRIINIVETLKTKEGKTNDSFIVGIYRLVMKRNSDNFRESSTVKIIDYLHESNIKIIVYEPLIKLKGSILDYSIIDDLENFKKRSDIIIANRYCSELADVIFKVYTRDIFDTNQNNNS